MGHEQVKISERFILHSENDRSTKSAGYFFARNKDLKLPEADQIGVVNNSGDKGN